MESAAEVSRPSIYIDMSIRQVIGVVIVGLTAGVVSWGLAAVIDQYILHGMLCQTMMTPQCQAVPSYSRSAAMLIAGLAAVFTLVQLQVFRPLLVAIGVVASLWGLGALIGSQPMFAEAGIYAGAFTLAYLAFTWIARLRSFWVSFVLMVALVAAVRFLLN
ncbi:MAG TPA: hypothetical protein VJ841_03900 [Candidatus Saccharimonadales bacterium]|nr:hypothetical protein [Candidatus Saccharimonadales bacterium]